VFEVAIDGLEPEAAAPATKEEDVDVPAPPPVPPAPGGELEQDMSRRFEDLGARLTAGIQESVLRKLEEKLGPRATAGEPSAVDDIAARFESLGAEIDERVRAVLREKERER
jgi:hypothetical protein